MFHKLFIYNDLLTSIQRELVGKLINQRLPFYGIG